MPTTAPRSTSATLAWVLVLCAGAAAAWAQSAPSNSVQRFDWPRTNGQPDFAFTREEAKAEARSRAARENEPMPANFTLLDLMQDTTQLDPLGLGKINTSNLLQAPPSDTTSAVNPFFGGSLMDKLLANAPALPRISSSYQPDVTEFRTALTNTISETISTFQPNLARYDVASLLRNLTLQAIVTSPVRYAVINQQRYNEGDTFQLQIPVNVPDPLILQALQQLLPPSNTMPAATAAEYQQVFENTLATFGQQRAANPAIGQKTLVVPVLLKTIEARQVQLEINGQPHVLAVKFAY